MSGLPKNWSRTTLGCLVNYGETEKVEPAKILDDEWVLELEDIDKNTSVLLSRVSFWQRKSKSTKNRFKSNDVLYGKLRPYLNKLILADKEGVCSTEIIPIRSPEGVLSKFVFYALKRPEFLDYVREVSHGMDMPRLGTKAGKSASIPLPPLAEQHRIVTKLDSLQARTTRARQELDHIPKLIERYKQAILDVVYSDIMKVSQTKSLVELVDPERGIPYGIVQTGTPTPNGVPTIRSGDIKNFDIQKGVLKKVAHEIEEKYHRTSLRGGEVLISIRGTIGNPAVVNSQLSGSNISREVAMVPVLPGIDPHYICYFLSSPFAQKFIGSHTKGVAQSGINLRDLRQLPTPAPSLIEQKDALQKITSAFKWLDKIRTEHARASHLLPKLDQAILAKAFRGELVPQDPNDEPASILLERIQEERKAQEKPKRK